MRYHKAVYAGITLNLTINEWAGVLGTNNTGLHRALISYETMQNVIDELFFMQSKIGEMWYRVTYRKSGYFYGEANEQL